jgi:hypothetical protein
LQIAYDAIFKLMVICYTEETNNCRESRKYSISEANVWWQKKDNAQLLGASSLRKVLG